MRASLDRLFAVLAVAASVSLAACDDSRGGDGSSSASTNAGGSGTGAAIGLSGQPLSPRLSAWADAFFRVSASLSAVGEGPPDEQDDRCRDRLSKLAGWRDDLADAPESTLDELQEQFVDRLGDYYRACAGSSNERVRLLQRTTAVGTKIHDRLRELDVPQQTE